MINFFLSNFLFFSQFQIKILCICQHRDRLLFIRSIPKMNSVIRNNGKNAFIIITSVFLFLCRNEIEYNDVIMRLTVSSIIDVCAIER